MVARSQNSFSGVGYYFIDACADVTSFDSVRSKVCTCRLKFELLPLPSITGVCLESKDTFTRILEFIN